jgi:hypothetical protein
MRHDAGGMHIGKHRYTLVGGKGCIVRGARVAIATMGGVQGYVRSLRFGYGDRQSALPERQTSR